MKIIGRILLILAVFSALSGLMVVAVNASGTSAVPSDLNGASSQFRPTGGGDGEGTRPEGGGFRPEHGGERGGAGGMFGLVKNLGVMVVLVTIIALPRSLAKKKRKQEAVNSVNSEAEV
jgi:hypothetical protein